MGTEITLSRELLPPGSRVLCAVSGGADSVCLLDLVRRLEDVECVCAHYDHGLRGEESRRDAEFVEDLCRQWGIELISGAGNVAAHAKATGQSIETAARELRYTFLAEAAEQCGADRIATAHNLNDNVETVLFHMARGTGLRGLTGIPPRRGNIVRPLLGVSRTAIEAYLAERGIPHVEDATNASDDYARNYARHHILPAMEKLHGGALENIGRMAENLSEDEAFLTSLAEEWLAGQRPGELSAEGLRALPRPVAVRALRLWLGEELSRERTQAVLELCGAGPSARLDLPGRRVYRRYDALTLTDPERPALPVREVRPGETLDLPEAGLRLECRFCTDSREIQTSLNIFSFSYANISGTLTVASRGEGEKLTLLGRRGKRSVKKLLAEHKIPSAARDSVPVLRDDNGVLAVYGVGQSSRAAPQPGEPFYKIIFEPLNKMY